METFSKKAEKLGVEAAYDKTANVAYGKLVERAKAGIITALHINSMLLCEGIYVPGDLFAGIEQLSVAADWANLPSVIAMTYYNTDNKQRYINKLCTVAAGIEYNGNEFIRMDPYT